VIVPGDVNSTLAAALAAVKLGIPVAHLESGLRSFDWTMPEEINRVLVDRVSTLCFVHSPEAIDHLQSEGIPEERIRFVGNTMIDTLVRLRPRIEDATIHARLGIEKGKYLLVTLHRPKLVDAPLLDSVIGRLDRLATTMPVVFPMHPRTRARLEHGPERSPGLLLTDPVGYVDFLALEAHAAGVITDSGGVQEETTFLGVPCFTFRENTERPVTISEGTNTLLGLDPAQIELVPDLLQQNVAPLRPPRGWDGRAAERVADELIEALSAGGAAEAASA
jgi:UDP-N-acetylglucosamine 2-epimerase (non-hydrolysing)